MLRPDLSKLEIFVIGLVFTITTYAYEGLIFKFALALAVLGVFYTVYFLADAESCYCYCYYNWIF